MFESLTTPKPKKPQGGQVRPTAPAATLSLREVAATAALQGLITFHGHAYGDEKLVGKAVGLADLLVAELNATGNRIDG